MFNDETGDFEVQPKTFDFSKTFFAPYNPKANRMFKMLKNKYDINKVFKKPESFDNILKNSSRTLTDKFNHLLPIDSAQKPSNGPG